ncbi:MAG: hypothetical protein JNK82_00430, partial [Myxococcaceae bacterium]|nr:hypothetical protein [Myxococcaceae bacterium]
MQAPQFNLTFNSCPATAACASPLPGTWYYTAGCVNDPFAQARTACAGATTANVTGTGRGCVTFGANTVTRRFSTSITGTIVIPASCLLGGALTCTQVQTALRAYYPNATCTASAGAGCDCTATIDTPITENASPYTNSAGVVTVAAGTYNTCVSPAGTLKYTRTGGQSLEDGQFTLMLQ